MTTEQITATLTTYRIGGNELRIADETGNILYRLVVGDGPSPFAVTENHPRVAFLIQRYGYVQVGDWHDSATDWQRTVALAPHPQRCATCVDGCDCETGSPGCGHAFCWGVVDESVYNTCPGAEVVTTAGIHHVGRRAGVTADPAVTRQPDQA